MADVIIVMILLLIIGGAVIYIVRAKRKGVKCIGCPDGATCSGSCGGNCSGCGGNCSEKEEQ